MALLSPRLVAAQPQRKMAARLLAGLPAVAMVLLLGACLPGRSVAVSQDNQGIHVSGRGEVLVEPDIARFTLQVTRQGRDAAALKKEMDQVTASVLKLTDSAKVPREDVTAAMVQINPNYVRQNNRQVIDGVVANRTINITLRDLDQIGQLMNRALELGINNIGGVQLDTSKRVTLEGQALDLAIDDAKAEAERVAKGFGVRLMGVRNVQVTGHHNVNPRMARMAMADESGGDSFAAGQIVIKRELQATFAIGGQ